MLCFLLLAITITIRNKIQEKGMNINKTRTFQTLKWETRNRKLKDGGDINIIISGGGRIHKRINFFLHVINYW